MKLKTKKECLVAVFGGVLLSVLTIAPLSSGEVYLVWLISKGVILGAGIIYTSIAAWRFLSLLVSKKAIDQEKNRK